MSKLQRIFENADYNVRSYSGRGMYGKTCLGVEIPNLGDFLSDLVEGLVGVEEDECLEVAASIRYLATDSMGQGMIVYFPRTPFDSEDSDEQVEDED